MPKATVIISFYNKIDYLRLVLAGFESQTEKDFEVIVADDGSRDEVVSQLKEMTGRLPFDLTHIWQEDKGFRKNRILNKAVAASKADYLIFVDGDCVPHREFVKEHLSNSEENVCFTGRRVNLSEKMTSRLTEEKIKKGFFEKEILSLMVDEIFRNSFDVEKGFYFKNALLRKLLNMKKRGLLGSNFSIHKSDLYKINCFDERYEAPSIGEDTDIQFRLELAGVKIRSLNNIAVQYHLYHKLLDRPQVNLDLFDAVKVENRAFTPFGIIKPHKTVSMQDAA